MTLVAARPLTVAGREVAPGEPLPDGLPRRTVAALRGGARVREAGSATVRYVARRPITVLGERLAPGDPVPGG
ncbi:MAG: hypothetical protein ACODAE_10925, partial [Gemmatimonadota bacterium]